VDEEMEEEVNEEKVEAELRLFDDT